MKLSNCRELSRPKFVTVIVIRTFILPPFAFILKKGRAPRFDRQRRFAHRG